MKLVLFCALTLLICYIHLTSSESSVSNKAGNKPKKVKDKAPAKSTASSTEKTKDENKEFKKSANAGATTKDKSKMPKRDTDDRTATKDKSKVNTKDSNGRPPTTKAKKTPNIRTPFDKVLDKLSNCASSSPTLVEVMQENLKELQSDEKYTPLFNAAPHTTTFLNKKKQDSTKFIGGLQQALNADWSNPVWKSWNEIDTLFRPLKQQFVYAMMRFNCT